MYTSLTMWWMDLYPYANLRKSQNLKSQSDLRLLQNIFIQFIWIINYVYYGLCHERVNSFFFSPIIVANVFLILFIKVTPATKWNFLKMCHLRCRLIFFLFHGKVMYHSQDIQVSVFWNIPWFTKSIITSWSVSVHETGCLFEYIFWTATHKVTMLDQLIDID